MRMRKTISFVSGLFFLAALAQAGPAFSLKLYGGIGLWATGGDFKDLFGSTADRWTKVGYTGTFDLAWKPVSFEGGLQAVAMITPRFGLAAGIGCLTKTINQDSNAAYPGGSFEQINSYQIQSIPVSLDLLYVIPAGPIRILLSAGATYYSSQIKTDEHSLDSEPSRAGKPNWKWDYEDIFQSDRKGTLGFQFGFGAEIALIGPASLCLDVFYRSVSFDDIQGTERWIDRETWTGGSNSSDNTSQGSKMWYETSHISGNTWHYLQFGKTMPTTGDEERLFKISMDGPVLRLGIKIGL
jgi:hypothetical protein